MRIHPSSQRGSILMLTVLTVALIGLAIAAYLNLVGAQNYAVARSQMWNSAIPAAEAGIEEALTHLNSVGTNSRAANGWTLSGSSYTLSRSLTSSRYTVTITTNDPPVVTSVGYIKVPFYTNELTRTVVVNTTKISTGMQGLVSLGAISLGPGSVVDSWDSRLYPSYSAAAVRSNSFAGAVGGNINNGLIKGNADTGPAYTVSSTVTGTTNNDLNLSFPDVSAPFSGGIPLVNVANQTVNFTNYYTSTNSVVTNVYPSPDPGGVVTTYTLTTNSVQPVGTNFSSYTTTTNVSYAGWPGTGYTITTNLGPVVSVNSKPATHSYVSPYSKSGNTYTYTSIVGYSYTITNYVLTNYSYSYRLSATTTNITSGTYAYVLTSGNYIAYDAVSMSGHDEMLVIGNAVLWVQGGISLSGQAQITVQPGATLAIYVGNTNGSAVSASFSGNGAVNNDGNTTSLSVFGLPTATSITIAGNGSFIGTVYAPEATLYGHGGGNDTDDFQGAAVVGNVSYNGHVNFHYDEKLGDTGGVISWNVASWREY